MEYALIENGIVTNIIWLHPMNADEFPKAMPIEDLPVQIGDTYDGEKFYHEGKEVTNDIPTYNKQSLIDEIIAEVNA